MIASLLTPKYPEAEVTKDSKRKLGDIAIDLKRLEEEQKSLQQSHPNFYFRTVANMKVQVVSFNSYGL